MTPLKVVAALALLLPAVPSAADAWIRLPATTFATLPAGTNNPEGIAADPHGNIYVTTFDVTKAAGPGGGAVTAWVTDALLATTGVPPFGANGLAFDTAGTALFVCNTGDDTVVQIPVGAGGNPGTPSVFVNSVNGCDGLIIDDHDNLWVAANQADEIAVLNPGGRVIAKLGDFNGLDPHGAPRGLLFPASLVRSGPFIHVTNLSLDLRLFGLPQTVDSQWTAQVRRHTVAKIPARIPPVPGLKK